MPRDSFDLRIHHLQDEILLLGSMVEEAVLNSVNALKRRDLDMATRIYQDDILINEKRFAIENAILILMATQQPIAHDLRLLAAMLEVSNELERMGDYAKGIAKVTMKLHQIDAPVPIQDISRMAELAVSMLHRALGAFIREDLQVARQIPAEDDIVDELYNKVYHQVVEVMIENPDIIDYANLSMWVAHNLERLADRVTNICERTVFIATGEMLEFDSEDDEDDDD